MYLGDFIMNIEQLEEEQTLKLKRLIKSKMAEKGYTLETLASALKENYGASESKANLSNKLQRGSLRYIEFERIMNVMGFKIKIEEN